LWPNRPLCSLTKLPGNLNRVTAENELRRLKQNFLLPRADLSLDNLDGQGFLLPTNQSGDAIPDANRTVVGSMASTLASDVGRRQVYGIAYMVRLRGTRRSGRRGRH
jgi:hypothetical protein